MGSFFGLSDSHKKDYLNHVLVNCTRQQCGWMGPKIDDYCPECKALVEDFLTKEDEDITDLEAYILNPFATTTDFEERVLVNAKTNYENFKKAMQEVFDSWPKLVDSETEFVDSISVKLVDSETYNKAKAAYSKAKAVHNKAKAAYHKAETDVRSSMALLEKTLPSVKKRYDALKFGNSV